MSLGDGDALRHLHPPEDVLLRHLRGDGDALLRPLRGDRDALRHLHPPGDELRHLRLLDLRPPGVILLPAEKCYIPPPAEKDE